MYSTPLSRNLTRRLSLPRGETNNLFGQHYAKHDQGMALLGLMSPMVDGLTMRCAIGNLYDADCSIQTYRLVDRWFDGHRQCRERMASKLDISLSAEAEQWNVAQPLLSNYVSSILTVTTAIVAFCHERTKLHHPYLP